MHQPNDVQFTTTRLSTDVTLHYADVMHASPAPTGAGGRRVLYLTWYNPAVLDFVGPGQARNDLVRDRQAAAADLVTK